MSDLRKAVADVPEPEPTGRPRLEVEASPEGGKFSGFVTDRLVDPRDYPNAFAEVYRLSGLDPEQYRIVDDTIRWSSWQQSKRTDDGHRDIITLFAYSARFVRVTREDLAVEDIAALTAIAKANARKRPKKAAGPLTRVVVAGDAQTGKVGSRGGTQELLERIAGLLEDLDEEMLRVPCEDALVADPGDLTEGFENVAAQKQTNDLSFPSQLRVARALVTDIVSTVAARHKAVVVLTCPSNHGAWRDGKNYLGKPGDDFGIDIHRAVAEKFAVWPRYKHVRWVFPGEWEQSVTVPVRGAVVGLAHGHMKNNPNQIPDWWKGQSHGSQALADATILLTGHWHHYRMQPSGMTRDGQPRWWVQAPTMDNGSDWWRNLTGDESEPGILTFTIDDEGRWDNLRLIIARRPA